jgi:predicted O-methyltransferase YrrM
MKLNQIAEAMVGIPWMTSQEAAHITSIIAAEKPRNILELGFKHGVSTCYMAGALQEVGGGHITSIDLTSAGDLHPNADQLLRRFGLEDFATLYYEETSYTWRLLEMLERNPRPCFDLCYLDGAHNWDTDGFAFFLVDKLLNGGALLIMDDMNWTYAKCPTLQGEPWVKEMPRVQYEMPQVRKVFDLLVREHPGYGEFKLDHGWGIARKLSGGVSERQMQLRTQMPVVTEVIRQKEQVGLGAALLKLGGSIKRRIT